MNLDRTQASELAQLMFVWDREYRLACDGETWTASPLSEPIAVLSAESAADLRELLREDAQQRKRSSWPLVAPWRAHKPGRPCWCGSDHTLLEAQEINDPGD